MSDKANFPELENIVVGLIIETGIAKLLSSDREGRAMLDYAIISAV